MFEIFKTVLFVTWLAYPWILVFFIWKYVQDMGPKGSNKETIFPFSWYFLAGLFAIPGVTIFFLLIGVFGEGDWTLVVSFVIALGISLLITFSNKHREKYENLKQGQVQVKEELV